MHLLVSDAQGFLTVSLCEIPVALTDPLFAAFKKRLAYQTMFCLICVLGMVFLISLIMSVVSSGVLLKNPSGVPETEWHGRARTGRLY